MSEDGTLVVLEQALNTKMLLLAENVGFVVCTAEGQSCKIWGEFLREMCGKRPMMCDTKWVALRVILKQRIGLVVDNRTLILQPRGEPERIIELCSNLQLAHPEVEVYGDNKNTVPILFDFATNGVQLLISTVQHNARQDIIIKKNTKNSESEGTGTDLCCHQRISGEVPLVEDDNARCKA